MQRPARQTQIINNAPVEPIRKELALCISGGISEMQVLAGAGALLFSLPQGRASWALTPNLLLCSKSIASTGQGLNLGVCQCVTS